MVFVVPALPQLFGAMVILLVVLVGESLVQLSLMSFFLLIISKHTVNNSDSSESVGIPPKFKVCQSDRIPIGSSGAV